MTPRFLLAALLLVTFSQFTSAAEQPPRLPGHRNLFNGDCNFLLGEAFVTGPDEKYPAERLTWFIDMLADCGVDTYLNNPCAQVPWYPSRQIPNMLTNYRRGDRDFFRGHYPPGTDLARVERRITDFARYLDRFVDLADAQVNWVEVISQACRRRSVSPWLSVRMNDMHGGGNWDASHMNCALQRNPKYRLSGRKIDARGGVDEMLRTLDYEHPEVRDYMLAMIRELVEEYDYEGLELDWLRCSFCLDAPASPDDVAMITKWHREIRVLTERQAAQRGKPYPLGLRIPCRLGQLKAIGIDVKAMVDAGLIDFVNVSNFFQTTWDVPYEELRRELGDQVAIYGGLEAVPNWLDTYDPQTKTTTFRHLPTSPELIRGNAAGKLVAGVDGLETFNFFVADAAPHQPDPSKRRAKYPVLNKLADLASLRGLPKHYTLATRDGAYLFPLYEYAEQIPIIIEAQRKQAFRLTMAAEPADAPLELVVQVVTDRQDQPEALGVSFNGLTPTFEGAESDELLFPADNLTHHAAKHRASNFRLPVSAIRDGWNEVIVFNDHSRRPQAVANEGAVRIVSMELAVRPSAKP